MIWKYNICGSVRMVMCIFLFVFMYLYYYFDFLCRDRGEKYSEKSIVCFIF